MPYAEPAQIPTKELSGIEALPYPTTVDKLYRIENALGFIFGHSMFPHLYEIASKLFTLPTLIASL